MSYVYIGFSWSIDGEVGDFFFVFAWVHILQGSGGSASIYQPRKREEKKIKFSTVTVYSVCKAGETSNYGFELRFPSWGSITIVRIRKMEVQISKNWLIPTFFLMLMAFLVYFDLQAWVFWNDIFLFTAMTKLWLKKCCDNFFRTQLHEFLSKIWFIWSHFREGGPLLRSGKIF